MSSGRYIRKISVANCSSVMEMQETRRRNCNTSRFFFFESLREMPKNHLRLLILIMMIIGRVMMICNKIKAYIFYALPYKVRYENLYSPFGCFKFRKDLSFVLLLNHNVARMSFLTHWCHVSC